MKFLSVCSGIEAASVKVCPKCQQSKPVLDGFHVSRKASDGRASWCKPCTNSIKRASIKRNYTQENKRKWALKSRYGLTPEQYDSLLLKQGGACAVCRLSVEKYHVDHCHNTGQVRGLLCHKCNIRLGGWDDLPWRSSAMDYLGIKGAP